MSEYTRGRDAGLSDALRLLDVLRPEDAKPTTVQTLRLAIRALMSTPRGLCPKCALPACMHTAGADDRAEMLGEDK